jgi:hypothetical protein
MFRSALFAISAVIALTATSAFAANKGKYRHTVSGRSSSSVSTPSQGNAAEDRLRNIMNICRCAEYDRAKGAY